MTMAIVWRYDIVACRGLVAGAVSTLMKLGFPVLVSAKALAATLLLFAACMVVAFALAATLGFRTRRKLLYFLLPVTAMSVSFHAAKSGHLPISCSLSPWR